MALVEGVAVKGALEDLGLCGGGEGDEEVSLAALVVADGHLEGVTRDVEAALVERCLDDGLDELLGTVRANYRGSIKDDGRVERRDEVGCIPKTHKRRLLSSRQQTPRTALGETHCASKSE